MVLTLVLLVPALAGVWLLVAARTRHAAHAPAVARAASVVTLLLVLLSAWLRPQVDVAWVPALGMRWHLAVDGIGIPLLLLTAALSVAVVAHARGREPHRDAGVPGSTATFYACLLLVEFAALATFLARDAILFFVAFELVLVPMWLLISRFGDEHASEAVRTDASYRFVFFTVLGSTLMLLGILVVVTSSGTSDLTALAAAHGSGMDHATQVLAAALLVTGLGIKVPLWPAHTWLPPAHTVAPTAGSVLLAAVLLKMGTYGIIRVAIPTVPEGFHTVAPFLAASGAVGILWGGLACLVERDLKRLVAYSSVAHMGFVALGLASGTQTGLQAALFANIAHGLVSALLFFVVGGLKERWGGADLAVARDALRDVSPRMGYALLVGFAAAIGLPGLVGFWGEFLAVYAAWTPAPNLPVGLFRLGSAAAILGIALAAAYGLRVLRLVWAGHASWSGEPATLPDERTATQPTAHRDASGVEWAVIAVLVVAVFGAGVLPRPLLALTAPDATAIVKGASSTTTSPGAAIVEAGR